MWFNFSSLGIDGQLINLLGKVFYGEKTSSQKNVGGLRHTHRDITSVLTVENSINS